MEGTVPLETGPVPTLGGKDAGPLDTRVADAGRPAFWMEGIHHKEDRVVMGRADSIRGEVSSGMGGFRVVGPTGRNQQYVPGCDPTQRKK